MYSGLSDTCSCYIGLAQNLVLFYLAFALARLMALRRLVAGRALEFEGELCTMCSCIVAGYLSWLALDGDITNHGREHEHLHNMNTLANMSIFTYMLKNTNMNPGTVANMDTVTITSSTRLRTLSRTRAWARTRTY